MKRLMESVGDNLESILFVFVIAVIVIGLAVTIGLSVNAERDTCMKQGGWWSNGQCFPIERVKPQP